MYEVSYSTAAAFVMLCDAVSVVLYPAVKTKGQRVPLLSRVLCQTQLGTNPAMLEQLLMEMFVPDTAQV